MEREDRAASPYTITLGGLFNRANFRPDRRRTDTPNAGKFDRRASDSKS
jgi:hypothetical protein